MECVPKESLKASEPLVEARSIEFRVLGPLEARVGDRTLPLGGIKQRALLAALLLQANEVVASDRLIDELWGAEPPRTAATALQVYVSQLRKALRADRRLLLTRAGGYLIALEPDQLDLGRFERLASEGERALADGDPASALASLRTALDLWHGPPLADLTYEPFARVPIMRLEELHLAAIEARVEAELALGHHEAIIGELESLVGENPFRERLRGQLMVALYRSGRQAEALAAYRSGRRLLVDELGIEPGGSLRHLERAILRQEPALAQVPAPDRSILVVPEDERSAGFLVGFAAALSVRPARELVLVRVVASQDDVARATAPLLEQRNDLVDRGLAARAVAFASATPGAEIVRLASRLDVDLLLLELVLAEDAFTDTQVHVLSLAPCDVGLLAVRPPGPGAIVVPFGAADHDWAALELGAWIARSAHSGLKLVGAKRRRGKRDASRLLADASLAVQYTFGVTAEPLLIRAGTDDLVESAEEAALLIVGLSDRWHGEGLGEFRTRLVRECAAPVLFVRRGVRPSGLAPHGGRPATRGRSHERPYRRRATNPPWSAARM
jgi:DNA-binding SARP family transcriptional activator